MSPVDPVFLTPSKPTGTQPVDAWSCISCGYDLAGLEGKARCPECGEPFDKSADRHPDRAAARFHFDEQLSDAPIGYLRSMLMAVVVLALSLPVIQASHFILQWGVVDKATGALVLIALGLVWWLAVGVVTDPRRTTRATAAQMRNEYRWLRVINRVVQSFWMLAGGAALVVAMVPGTRLATVGSILYMLLMLAAMFGLAPLCEQLRSIALWGQDEGLGERLNFAGWGVAGCGSFVLVAPFLAALAGSAGILVGYLGFIASLLFALVNLLLMVCLFQFVPMFRWSLIHWSSVRARTERLRERHDDRRAGVPEPTPPIRPRPLPVLDDSPIPLAGSDAPGDSSTSGPSKGG